MMGFRIDKGDGKHDYLEWDSQKTYQILAVKDHAQFEKLKSAHRLPMPDRAFNDLSQASQAEDMRVIQTILTMLELAGVRIYLKS